ncbi:MAG: Sec-independent protein translocase subunit TatA/TatB [Verrucomicrobiota bacterium]
MPELLIVFVIILLLFGAKRLPELFRSFGKSLNEFKKATRDIETDIQTAMHSDPEESKKKDTPDPAPVSSQKSS